VEVIDSMFNWLKKLGGDSTTHFIEKAEPLADEINALEPEIEALSNEEIRARTQEFRDYIAEGTTDAREAVAHKRSELDAEADPDRRIVLRDEWKHLREDLLHEEQRLLNDILPEAFALAREAARRTIGQRHFDVQLMGGVALHQGKIAEMKTGEGKTLTATLPLYLNALAGHGAHLVTVNDYLARRDCGWMGQIFHLLGLSTGVIIPDFSGIYDPTYTEEKVLGHDERLMHLRPVTRQEAYGADITYGTNNEFGFDYLRDNMAQEMPRVVQRELYYAIVDEVDNILIDEARTPLIISAPDEETYKQYIRFAQVAHTLMPGDYEIDEKERGVTLTEQGVDRVERQLGVDHERGESLYDDAHAELTFFLESAMKARFLFEKDKDYVIKDGEVVIVDEFTGRLMAGRRWSDGIHEAIEAKERFIYKEPVEIQRESKTFATITFQNYFRLYQKLAGMTGTAATEQEEFFKIYYLDVVVIPTHRPMIRADFPDRIYAREEAKFRAVVQEIAQKRTRSQPVLVGTTSVERSEYLSRLLQRERIPHEVLNAKQHEREALIVAKAGQPGAVTIATNMAGRGTDILLGPAVVRPECIDPETGLSKCCVYCKENCEECFKERRYSECTEDVPCGLHIIGTERHEARRIDNQLRGRSGRQGDPGSSRFYVSTEDEIMRRFGPGADRMRAVLERFNPEDDTPIEARVISRMIEQAQVRVEGYHFDMRKHLVGYDDVLNRQREVIYAERRRILDAEDVHGLVLARLREEISARVAEAFDSLKARREYERDNQAVLAALGSLVEGIQSGRHTREESRMALFPVIGQAIVERLQEEPVLQAYAQVQEAQQRLLTEPLSPETQREEGAKAQELLQSLGEAAPPAEGQAEPAEQITALREILQKRAQEILLADLTGVLEEALAYRQERFEETVGQTIARYLGAEEADESGLHLSRLYRELTHDLKVPLPATVTAARWMQMEPEAIEEEVLEVVQREMADDARRSRQRILEGMSRVAQDWASHGNWWVVNDFLNDLDRYALRLPPRLAGESLADLDQERVEEELYRLALGFLESRERRVGTAVMRIIERGYLLRTIDREWIDYLTAMEDLRQGIGLRAYGQQDPLVEYRRESYHLFERLMQRVREQTLFYIFRASQAPVLQRAPLASQGARQPARALKAKEPSKKARRKEARRQQGAQQPAGPLQRPAGQSPGGTAPAPGPGAPGSGRKKRRRRKR
jgi:preprotein translocase subunit SecA